MEFFAAEARRRQREPQASPAPVGRLSLSDAVLEAVADGGNFSRGLPVGGGTGAERPVLAGLRSACLRGDDVARNDHPERAYVQCHSGLDDHLQNPGWREWKRSHMAHTLYFDDPPLPPGHVDADFIFSPEIEKQHAVVIQYLGLEQSIYSLKECEYYFRRYPFRSLPGSRHGHITNVSEMYFGRFYEFKERMKRYFQAIKSVEPNHRLEIGKFVKLFEKEFDQELLARNQVHHYSRFEDIAIDRVFLTETLSVSHEDKGWKQEYLVTSRKLAREWAQRVRRRGAKMDEFLEAIANATLSACHFLASSQVPSD